MRISRVSRQARAAERGPRLVKRRRPDLPTLEWAEDMTGRCPRITAVGSHSLMVENHTGLLSFSDTRVVLDSHAGSVCVMGRGLSLGCVCSGAMIVRGEVQRVELPCKGGDAPDEG